MKKLLIVLCVLFFSIPAMAAEIVQAEIDYNIQWKNDQRLIRIKLYYQSDGSDLAEFNLSTYLSPPQTDTNSKVHRANLWTEHCQGGLFYQYETDPGTAPDAAYDLNIASDIGSPILALTGLSTTASALAFVSDSVANSPSVIDLKIDFGDIGSDADEVTLYIYIIR